VGDRLPVRFDDEREEIFGRVDGGRTYPSVRTQHGECLVTAAREALPTTDAVIARRILAADLALLTDLDAQSASQRPNSRQCCQPALS
jgi:hypothetical protein